MSGTRSLPEQCERFRTVVAAKHEVHVDGVQQVVSLSHVRCQVTFIVLDVQFHPNVVPRACTQQAQAIGVPSWCALVFGMPESLTLTVCHVYTKTTTV